MAAPDPGIETDACPEAEEEAQTNITAEPETEYFDGVLVYADEDYNIAVSILDFMTNIKLADGTCPKVVLHEHAKFSVSKVEKSEKVLKCCSFVFVVTTKQLSKDNYADYIKDEVIADTRINDDIPSHQRYRVIPLHTKAKRKRDYKIPIGLRSIQSFDVYDEKCKRSQDHLRQLFDKGYLHYRSLTVRPMHKQECQAPEENGDTHLDPIDNHPEHNIQAQNQCMGNQNLEDNERRGMPAERTQSPFRNAHDQVGNIFIRPNKQEQFSNRCFGHSEIPNVHGVSKGNQNQVLLDQEQNSFRFDEHENASILQDNNSLAPKENNSTLKSTSRNLTVSKNEAKEVSSFDHDHLDLQSTDLSMDEPEIKQGCKRTGQVFSVKEQAGSSDGQPRQGTGDDKHEKREMKCNSDHYPVKQSDYDFHDTNTPEEAEIRITEQTEDTTLPKVAHSDFGKESGNQSKKGNKRKQVDNKETNLPPNTLVSAEITNNARHTETKEVVEACKSTPEVREVTADEAKGTTTSIHSELQDFNKPINQRHALGNEMEESDCNLSKSTIRCETIKENENEGRNSKKAIKVENLKRGREATENIPLNANDTTTQILPISPVAQNNESALETPRTNCTVNSYHSLNSTGENLNGFQSTDRIPEKEPPLEVADNSLTNSTLQRDQSLTSPGRDTTNPPDTKGSGQIYAENSILEMANVKCVEAQHKPFIQRMSKEQPLRCSDHMYNAASITTPDAQHFKDCSKIANNMNTSADEKQDDTPGGSSADISNTNDYTSQKKKLTLPMPLIADSMQEERCLNGATLTERKRKEAKCPQEHDERDPCSQEETLRNESSSSSNKILSADGPGKETKDHDYGNSLRMDFAKKKGITSFTPCRESSDINTPATKEPVDRYHLERENFQGNESAGKSILPHNANEKRNEPCEKESTAIHNGSSARGGIYTQIIISGTANIMIGNRNQLSDKRNDNPGEPQELSPEISVPEHEQEKLPLIQLSRDGIPSAPDQDLQPFTGGPKGHLPNYPDGDSKLSPKSKEGRDEDLSRLPSLPSHNDLVDELSGNDEETEEDGFLAKDEEPSHDDKRCFICCWKK